MKILIDTDLLVSKGISVEEYVFAYLINSKGKGKFQLSRYDKAFPISEPVILSIEDKGLVRFTTAGKRQEVKNMFAMSPSPESFSLLTEEDTLSEWIKEWVDLWPKRIRTAGYLVRPTLVDAERKLRTFRTLYPSYGKDIIMTATEAYIQRKAMTGYTFMTLGKYFVMKDGESILASECDAALDDEYNPVVAGEGYGEQEL
jgi:hypothetical protein